MTLSGASQANHLAQEKSPYLLQHAYNPVDWYPWGPEAFEKARKEDKPILVSIGYSTCHWCHVMERESYENPDVAALMNQYLVNIKVDREERPDVDKIYMTAVSAMTGSGGWPLNVFLTPDLKPFYGGTYYPPAAKWGHPGWSEVVTQIGTAWKDPEQRKKILESGDHITDALEKYADTGAAPLDGKPEWLDEGFKSLRATYDSSRGGFGDAPKFPMPVYHTFLMRYGVRNPPGPLLQRGDLHENTPLEKGGRGGFALEMSFHTLTEMAKGGIYDHLGGGFARYSTDANWHIPHFEKMLYDNAQLAVNYLEAYQISKEPEFARIARETLDYVLRDMTHPEGGFYSAEDADSLPDADSKEKIEGAFYVWEKKEILATVGSPAVADVFCFRYGVREGGNAAQDPHGEFKNKNILYAAHPIAETARQFNLSVEEAAKLLDQAKQMLFKARKKRPRPHLDDKVLSAWNGLMISAFAKGYQILRDEKDLKAAQKSAHFLKDHLYDAKNHLLYRRWRAAPEGRASPNEDGRDGSSLGIADDYAFVVQGLIDLYEADFDPAWLAWADELTDAMNRWFYDPLRGGYYMTGVNQDPHLLVRFKEEQDNVEPSASSVAALSLLRLAQFTDKMEYREKAQKTLQAFGSTLKQSPRAMPAMLTALDYALSDPRQIVIASPQDSASPPEPWRRRDTKTLLRVLNNHFMPIKIVAEASLPRFAAMKPIDGKATAYVCVHFTCKKPTTDPKEFEKQLTQ